MKKLILITLILTATVAHAQGVQYLTPTQTAQTDIFSPTTNTQSIGQTWVPATTQGLTPQQQQTLNFTSQIPSGRAGNITYTPLEPFYSTQQADLQINRLDLFLNRVFQVLISIGALFAVITLVIGGVLYMTSEATGTKDLAKKRMTSAIYGLLLLAGAYLILATINPQLLTLRIDPSMISGGNSSAVSGTPTATPRTDTEYQIGQNQCAAQQMWYQNISTDPVNNPRWGCVRI